MASSPANLQRHRCVNCAHAPHSAFSEAFEPRPMPLACPPPPPAERGVSPLLANHPKFETPSRFLPSVVEPKSCCWFRVQTHPRTENETRHTVVLLCGLPAAWCIACAAPTVPCLQPFAHPLRGENDLVCCVCDMLVCHCPCGRDEGHR